MAILPQWHYRWKHIHQHNKEIIAILCAGSFVIQPNSLNSGYIRYIFQIFESENL